MIDFKITLVDGASHDVDSSSMAFEIAGRAAYREVAPKGKPRILELSPFASGSLASVG